MRIREGEYAPAAKVQFELGGRLDSEWRARPQSARASELLPLLDAQARALGATVAALELINEPLKRWVTERAPSRADKIAKALDAYRLERSTSGDPRGLPWATPEQPAATLLFAHALPTAATPMNTPAEISAALGAPLPSVEPADGGASALSAFSAQGEVADLAGQLEAELNRLRQSEAAQPEAHAEYTPVQLVHLRQRRALAHARAALLRASAADASHVLPLPLPAAPGKHAERHGVGEAHGVLYELLRHGLFDAAVELAAPFNVEMREHATCMARPGGLPLVAYELAQHCVRLDLASVPSGAEGGESHNEWRRLRRLLERHDASAYDWDVGTAAARGALAAAPARPLPRWLIEYTFPPTEVGAGGTPPATLLRITSSRRAARSDYDNRIVDNDEFARTLQRVLDSHPAANATLRLRGAVGWRGDAHVIIPPHAPDTPAQEAAANLESELRQLDPGCMPLRRNPAALCRALLELGSTVEHLREVMRLVRDGCAAALRERDVWSARDTQRRDRWVTCGLIDKLHATVARMQGVAPWEADSTQPGELQPQLRECFDKIEMYLDIDLPTPWAPPDKARLISDAVVDGEWDGEPARAVVSATRDEPRQVATEEMFMWMLETAIKR